MPSTARRARGASRAASAARNQMLCPTARGAVADQDLIDEAEVEHASMAIFIAPLDHMAADTEVVGERFAVLWEYGSASTRERSAQSRPSFASRRT